MCSLKETKCFDIVDVRRHWYVSVIGPYRPNWRISGALMQFWCCDLPCEDAQHGPVGLNAPSQRSPYWKHFQIPSEFGEMLEPQRTGNRLSGGKMAECSFRNASSRAAQSGGSMWNHKVSPEQRVRPCTVHESNSHPERRPPARPLPPQPGSPAACGLGWTQLRWSVLAWAWSSRHCGWGTSEGSLQSGTATEKKTSGISISKKKKWSFTIILFAARRTSEQFNTGMETFCRRRLILRY